MDSIDHAITRLGRLVGLMDLTSGPAASEAGCGPCLAGAEETFSIRV